MADDLQTQQESNMSTLVAGIVNDAQQLIRQEMALARSELQQEWSKIKTAAMSLAVGGVVAFLGAILLLFGFVRLLHWATGAPDPAAVPLWAWFLIVGAVVSFVGGMLLFSGVSKASEVQVPPPQTTDSLKEIL